MFGQERPEDEAYKTQSNCHYTSCVVLRIRKVHAQNQQIVYVRNGKGCDCDYNLR